MIYTTTAHIINTGIKVAGLPNEIININKHINPNIPAMGNKI